MSERAMRRKRAFFQGVNDGAPGLALEMAPERGRVRWDPEQERYVVQ